MPITKNIIFEDGKWWYLQPTDNKRRSLDSQNRKNATRMFVAGNYVSKNHPMHKPGCYSTFEEAWSHKELDKAKQGYIYGATNPAWPGWVKVGMAVDAEDRLRGYQTSSPLRDYELLCSFKSENKSLDEQKAHLLLMKEATVHKGEWFQVDSTIAYTIITDLDKYDNPLLIEQEELPLQVPLQSVA